MIKYLVIIEKTKSGYSAYVPDLPGCIATGSNKRILDRNIHTAIKMHIEGLKEEGLPIPKPLTQGEVILFA